MSRFSVSDGSNVNDAQAYKVAQDGIVKPITRALVAVNGILREYWPTEGGGPSPIQWNTDPITVRDQVVDPANASAYINFSTNGLYTYKNHPDADGSGVYINPPLTGAGQYLIKVDQTSSNGDVITGTLATWVDLFQALSWSLDKGTVGTATETANISIAQDDGGGSPVSEVLKPVTFTAVVLDNGSKIAWTDESRALSETTEAVVADTELTFYPGGYAVGDADVGGFTEAWHVDYPGTVLNPENFTVQVDLISGDTPSGTLGAPLTLDANRNFKLESLVGETKSSVLDVTVSDGVVSITKRVNMDTEYIAPPIAPPVWTDAQWVLSDQTFPQGLAQLAKMTIKVNADGTAEGIMENDSGTESQQAENWHTDAPGALDPENYEAKWTNSNGVILGDVDTWVNLGTNQEWQVEFATRPNTREYFFTLQIRAIGGVAIEKEIKMIVWQDDGSQPL